MKVASVPNADHVILWPTLALACLYYVFGFLLFNQIRFRDVLQKNAYKSVTKLNIILAVASGIGLSILCIGALFTLLKLAGATPMLSIGLIVTTITLLGSAFNFAKNKDTSSMSIIWRTGIAVAAGLAIVFLPA